jgi:hypothetical protein
MFRLSRVLLFACMNAVAVQAQTPTWQLEGGRFTVTYWSPADATLGRTLLQRALANDTFPGLPRPRQSVVIAVAPDPRRFREMVGPNAAEWGVAFALPNAQRIVMQGRRARGDVGDPLQVLRHELAHLALHESLGDLPPRWFDEGYASYAAGEWDREDVLATNVALALRGMPSLDSLDAGFEGSSAVAQSYYALAYRAVSDLAALDSARGLSLLFDYWRQTGRLDPAIRRAYGVTLASFEQHWQLNTRRRYGALAIVADASIALAVLAIVVGPFYLLRRRRDRERMAALVRADEEAERRDRESAIDALLRSIPPPAAPPPHRDEPR